MLLPVSGSECLHGVPNQKNTVRTFTAIKIFNTHTALKITQTGRTQIGLRKGKVGPPICVVDWGPEHALLTSGVTNKHRDVLNLLDGS